MQRRVHKSAESGDEENDSQDHIDVVYLLSSAIAVTSRAMSRIPQENPVVDVHSFDKTDLDGKDGDQAVVETQVYTREEPVVTRKVRVLAARIHYDNNSSTLMLRNSGVTIVCQITSRFSPNSDAYTSLQRQCTITVIM